MNLRVRAFIPVFVLLALAGVSCSRASQPATPTPTALPPTPTLTLVPADTLTPFPALTQAPTLTPTPTPTRAPNSDVYTVRQKTSLYEVSLKYLASSDDDAVKVAQRLKFVKGADVSNMCGPLAIAMLRDADLLPATVDIHDFWLLNPRQPAAREVLARVFPTPEYVDYPIDQATNKFDFAKFPLKAGDFVYIYAGKHGSFEHMLTVTRVDGIGRAYTVTNLHSDSFHFAIREVVLYDPTQPGVGQFYDWTNVQDYQLGLTGYGGFEIWRRITALP